MLVKFISYSADFHNGNPEPIFENDLTLYPQKDELVVIGTTTYRITNVNHVFQSSGQDGKPEHTVIVQVRPE